MSAEHLPLASSEEVCEQTNFAEWRLLKLLERHALGLTPREAARFAGLTREQASAALERLRKAGACGSQGYARGELFSLLGN